MENMIILVGTGHRPDKLGGYNQAVANRVYKLACDELSLISPIAVISGMAQGWDQALALAALDLHIPLYAYVPFKGQEKKWPRESQLRYHQLLERAQKTVTVCEGDYAAWKMNHRNEAMVDAGTHVLALWNGSPGGTANCFFYARSQKKKIRNCWHVFMNGRKQREIEFQF